MFRVGLLYLVVEILVVVVIVGSSVPRTSACLEVDCGVFYGCVWNIYHRGLNTLTTGTEGLTGGGRLTGSTTGLGNSPLDHYFESWNRHLWDQW